MLSSLTRLRLSRARKHFALSLDEGDEDLDVMVNEPLPHQCTPFEQMQEDRNNQVAKLQDAENQKDREWRVGVENITEGRAKR